MSDDRDDKDGLGEVQLEVGGDSSSEMEIISEVFGDDQPAAATDQVFSMDLFGDSAGAPAPTEPPPDEPPGEADNIITDVRDEDSDGPTDDFVPPAAGDLAAAEPEDDAPATDAPAIDAPEPEAPAPTRSPSSSIKVVTDDDLRKLFDMSSPGFAPPEEDEVPAEEKEAALAARQEIREEEESTFSGPPAKVMDEVGDEIAEFESIARETGIMTPPEYAAPEETPSEDAPPEETPPDEAETGPLGDEGSQTEDITTPQQTPDLAPDEPDRPSDDAPGKDFLDDISPDEIVDQLETSAVVGEMTSVAAGKKGELLEKTRNLIGNLEPASGDYMKVEELTKLFNNVNVLIDLAGQLAERLDELEDRLETLEQGRGGRG